MMKTEKKYIVKDYLIYYTKTIVVPAVIAASVVLILNRTNNYD
ncbi:MAG: hypothetical protein WBJ13_14755 [Sedimentibacter sp.]